MLNDDTYTIILLAVLTMVCVGLTIRSMIKPQKLRKLVDKQADALIESELRFKTLFDKAPIGIAEVDTQSGSFIRVNRKLCDILGYTEQELYLTGFQTLTFSDDLGEDLLNMQKLKSGEINEFTLLKRYRHKDGRILWANLIVKSLWNDGESPTSHIGIIEDVTERLDAQEKAEHSQLRTTSLINTIDGIVWEADPVNFKFIFISKKVEEITGYTTEEWLGSSTFWADHIHPEDKTWVVDYCSVCTKLLKPHDFEYRMITKNGSVLWLRDIVSVISEDNEAILLRGVMIDITAHKQAERIMNDSLELVTDQNKRLLNFSYIVSHNLRSHTSNIEAIANLIEIACNDEERKELVNLLKRASSSLNQTLMHLNQVVNIQTCINENVKPLNVKDSIIKAISSLSKEIKAKEAIIREDGNCDIIVNYNPAYLDSILLNFIFNAIKFSHPDRVPEVGLNCFKENDQHVLQISDNGIGINLEKYGDELFGMYKTFTDKPESKGIGLFMSKNQIDAMGGKVTVNSVEGEGTTFNIYFKN